MITDVIIQVSLTTLILIFQWQFPILIVQFDKTDGIT